MKINQPENYRQVRCDGFVVFVNKTFYTYVMRLLLTSSFLAESVSAQLVRLLMHLSLILMYFVTSSNIRALELEAHQQAAAGGCSEAIVGVGQNKLSTVCKDFDPVHDIKATICSTKHLSCTVTLSQRARSKSLLMMLVN